MGSKKTQVKALHKPALHKPALHEPALHKPALHEPALHEPALHEPALHKPALHEPALHEPALHKPALHKPALNLLAKEEQYIRMNAELEAKTAALVRQAEDVMRDQNYILSKPIPKHPDLDFEDGSRQCVKRRTHPHPKTHLETKEQTTEQRGAPPLQQHEGRSNTVGRDCYCSVLFQSCFICRRPRSSVADVMTTEDLGLETTILRLEEKLEGYCQEDIVEEASPNEDSVGSEAQIRVLKAKLRIMQEELDRLSYDYSKKDDENGKLCGKIKELDEDRARLQKTTNIQQTHIEKHRALAEEASKRCDGLQVQVAGLQKEIEGLNRAQKQAAGNQNTVEVRLNRALEEVERLKAQLSNMKQLTKDRTKEVHQSKENLLAENKVLKKQREELILGFKKQLKLIDILKRQKMHFEAAKVLSFTEEEFMKALDWGKA
ncbi:unnamed protein product [Lota lota]